MENAAFEWSHHRLPSTDRGESKVRITNGLRLIFKVGYRPPRLVKISHKKVEITCGVPQEPFYVQYYFFFTIMIITANEKLCNLYDLLC